MEMHVEQPFPSPVPNVPINPLVHLRANMQWQTVEGVKAKNRVE